MEILKRKVIIVFDDVSELSITLKDAEDAEEAGMIYYCDECSKERHASIWHNEENFEPDAVAAWLKTGLL